MSLFFGGQGVVPSLGGLVTNVVSLNPGQCWQIPAAGWYQIRSGKYTTLQLFDPILQAWRSPGGGSTSGSVERLKVDGTTNYRLANQTGCAVGALLTAAGSGYVSPPVVTASVGGSLWRAIVGGAVNTTVSITNGGTNYTYPPIALFSAPPAGGVQATGFATLTGGVVTGVTIVDQGAGYTLPPTITFANDPREGVNNVALGVGAAAICTLTGAGTVTAVICIDHGNATTPAGTVPTLAFSGGGGTGAAATAIMCLTMTGYAVTGGGTGYTGPVSVTSAGSGFPATPAAYLNPTTQSQLVKTRPAQITAALAAGAITAAGQIVGDAGIFAGSVTPMVTGGGLPTGAATLTSTMGGQNDVSIVLTT